MTELERLKKEKFDLERRIHLLETGALVHETVKLDRIGFASAYQKGKWALFYRYSYIVNAGSHGVPQPRKKWQPLINGDSMDEVVKQIPDVINALTDLYEEAKHGTDT